MSEPKLISPMLDNFAIGGAISSHNGVSCYPAMENTFNDKYIVKIISVPASQTQLDALLLTGAYSSLDAALGYFKEVADGVAEEVAVLEKLSQLEGFLPYRAYQCEVKEDNSGYDVYLLSPYRRTLARQFTRNPLTQLDVLNLGLDMCSALSVCRKAGYLYVDLKPNNIFISTDKGFFIGDLGFISISSLKYASLPDRYRSEYTAPEIADAFSSLNTTVDIYALGLILYQAYNNGAMPVAAENGQFPAPEYADYEMSEIIMKAIAPNPADRWQDPTQMGQALISYMQRNGANDTPIIPPVIDIPVQQNTADGSIDTEETECNAVEEPTSDDITETTEDVSVAVPEMEVSDDDPEVIEESADPEIPNDEDYINLSFLDDEELPADTLNISYNEVTDEVSDILAQADELAQLQIPDPVVAPEPVEIQMPEPIVIEEESVADSLEDTEAEASSQDDSEESADDETVSEEAEEPYDDIDVPAKKKHRWVGAVIAIIIVLALLAGGFYYYQNYYLQTIDAISVVGSEDSVVVTVNTSADNALLTVVCADPHGNKLPAPVENGKAEISGLLPSTSYSVSVQIDGFHKLLGNTTATYSTPAQTNIVQISAVTGSEDGSVILGFTVEGPDSERWSVSYSAEGEDTELASFPGHTVSLNGLTVGKEYTFTLIPDTQLYITGNDQLKYTINKLAYAQDLTITSCMDNTLTAVWSAPADSVVESWTVRCNGENYSQTIITEETVAVFEGLDHTQAYTVEVVAAGMSVSQRAQVAANSATITNFSVDESVPNQLTLSWESSSDVPADGWIIQTLVDGTDLIAPIFTNEATATLENYIPGSSYIFTISDLDETQYLGMPIHYQSAQPALYTCNYEGYELSGEDITFSMCKRPAQRNWNRFSLHDEDYTNVFAPGEEASFLMHMEKAYGNSWEYVTTTYIIYDSQGIPVSVDSESAVWNNMWYRYYGELDIPRMPTVPGEYTISVLFDGALVNTQNFTITG